ncbi:MAG TPA: amidohydrolase [Flavobacteriaceae bacterium]|nr:amidohydrolase [Flavobacteriaceae bacterium]HAT64651.1 amidohydrolase [Flavobacteriaceae bacterium]|tara:strand:- start:49160 stop:50791 length:1632 start_codon:yes stop_codon:yes gene_type:complete
MKKLLLFALLSSLFSCNSEKPLADLIVTNAKIYTVNEGFETAEAFAIKDGKILEVGTSESILGKYKATETLDVDGKTVLPGLIDAHAHLYNFGLGLQNVDLVGTTSKEETLQKIVDVQKDKNSTFIFGRGWDQNDWPIKEFPTKKELDSLFPDTPVALSRIDGHALWVNTKTLEMAGITSATKMEGGEVVLENGEPSGIIVDSPMKLVFDIMPVPSREVSTVALKDAEKACVSLGLTTVNDAGLDRDIIELIESLQQTGDMKLRVYAMVSNGEENLNHFLNKGIVKTERLNVRSVKIYGDGALGSRGAALRAPYSDKEGHFGAMITSAAQLDSLAQRIAKAGYQMNTHAIGDSANVSVLRAYKKALDGKKDARWKIEHAQVVSLSDFDAFSKNIIPSIQPTHATSDMYWAEDRVGSERIKGAYAYKTLLKKAGLVALGTDFPVENVNPMYTFYAATARKDLKQYPENGYRKEEGLTREETLKGMTIWAAYSNFEENEKGSIEAGKFADFIIIDKDIMTCPEDEIPNIKVLKTFINGEKVFEAK